MLINSSYIGVDRRRAQGGVYGLRKHYIERLGGGFQDPPPFERWSLEFDGENDYAKTGAWDSGIEYSWTFSLWFKVKRGATIDDFTLLTSPNFKRSSVAFAARNPNFLIRLASASQIDLIFYTNYDWADATSTVSCTGLSIQDNTWYHFLASFQDLDTPYLTVYLDNVLIGSGSPTCGSLSSQECMIPSDMSYNGLVIGNSSGLIPDASYGKNTSADAYSRGFKGNIDEVAVWYEALTASNRTALYNNGRPGDINVDLDQDCSAWFRMGDAESSTVIEGTSTPNSLPNSASWMESALRLTLYNGPVYRVDVPG